MIRRLLLILFTPIGLLLLIPEMLIWVIRYVITGKSFPDIPFVLYAFFGGEPIKDYYRLYLKED